MADRLEISKLTETVALGPPADNLSVSKLVMYVLLEPGDDSGGETPVRVSHVYAQKITRA